MRSRRSEAAEEATRSRFDASETHGPERGESAVQEAGGGRMLDSAYRQSFKGIMESYNRFLLGVEEEKEGETAQDVMKGTWKEEVKGKEGPTPREEVKKEEGTPKEDAKDEDTKESKSTL